MNQLTQRQHAVYDFIASFQRRYGYTPTMQEIAGHLQISGNQGVLRHLAALEKKGFLARTPGISRSIRLIPLQTAHPVTGQGMIGGEQASPLLLPVVGTVRAGIPQPPLEDIQEYHSLDRTATRSGGTFFLRVKGDSMIGAAIREGDLALVRPQTTAEDRDIVVALVDGEATLKRFFRTAGHIRLQPENPAYQPIIIAPGEGEVALIGKVVGIHRTLV